MKPVTKKQLKIIFCVRDPRNLICSTHKNVPHDYFIGYRNQYFVVPDQGICQPSNPGIRDIMKAWRATKDLAFTLKYEELVTDPDTTQSRLFEFIGAEIDTRFSEFNENSIVAPRMTAALNGIRPIDQSGLDNWKQHPLRIWNEFTENTELFQILNELGYEKDSEWFVQRFRAKLPI